MDIFSSFWKFLKGLGTKRKWIAVAAVIIVVIGVGYVLFGPEKEAGDISLSEKPRSVTLLPVSNFAEGTSEGVTAGGSETIVRAEASGKIVSVLPVGTRVSSGSTIAQFENAAQRASLLQAEGSLEAAEANLEKVQGGPRSEQLAVLEAAVESAENAAVTTLLSTYSTVDSAIRDTADQMFSNADTSAPKLNFATSNNQRRNNLENQRVLLGMLLERQAAVSGTLSNNSDIDSELNTAEDELREVRSFIDTLIAALNEAIPTGDISNSDIANYKASATSARTALTSALSSIASGRGTLVTARKNLEEGLTGAEDTDIAAAAAAVKQAQGVYNAARAAYQKTIVRTPTNGTVLSCNATTSDVLSVGSDICRIQTAGGASGEQFVLPLETVKYTPQGAFVFIVNEEGVLESISIETGLVTAGGIRVTGLFGDEFIVSDVRGLKTGEEVTLQ